MKITYRDGEAIQKLRDQADLNLQRDKNNEEFEAFDDWKERGSNEYISAYCETLSELYNQTDIHGEKWAISNAYDEMIDWIDVYCGNIRHSDAIIAKIHACNDFMNGEDPFCKES